ncbi:AmmeMemoRadiSam system radical SAM enzyme [Microgenomates group bacterium RBG_16_45_19]|nr:MAG: AmmeMemoRadiSam system radical SAM enzyme [Microgenomates group bacterium RBG_16_45_19]
MKPAVLYQQLPQNRIQCQACAWQCNIAPGQTGVCGVRLNQNGKLYLTVYGQAVGLHLDPVEKKPLFHFLPGTTALSFGTVGCDFGCLFCQNWSMSQAPKGKPDQLQDIIAAQSETWSPQQIVAKAMALGARSIAYTYNEPAIFVEYAHDTAVLAKKQGLKNIFVSNGYESVESLDYMEHLLDAINIDIKSFSEAFYRQYCRAKLQPVLDTIKRVFKRKIHLELTTLVIPGKNDSVKELTAIANFIKQISPHIPWHVTAFHPDYLMADVPPTSPKTLVKAWNIGRKAGLNYVYLGNISDSDRATTNCPHCHQALIKRFWHQTHILANFDTASGQCPHCGTAIAGIWN